MVPIFTGYLKMNKVIFWSLISCIVNDPVFSLRILFYSIKDIEEVSFKLPNIMADPGIGV